VRGVPDLTRPTVGVVIAAYNAERWLPATLASLRAQTWDRWQCVVVDDGSTDGTPAGVRQVMVCDDRVRLLSQPNSGLCAARNAGIGALNAECNYVGFLDSDDLYEPETLEALVTALERRPDAVGAYGLADYVDEHGVPLLPGLHPSRQRRRHIIRGWRLVAVPAEEDATFGLVVVYGPIWPPAVALQRLGDVIAVGGFDESFPSQEDWDFYLRLTRRGPYVALDRRLAWYRRHGTNLTSDHATSVFHQERVRRNAYVYPDNTAAEIQLVRRAWRLLEARQVAVLLRHAVRCLAQRKWHRAAEAAFGVLICLAQQLRPGPPPASTWRVRYTRPAELPGAVLIPH